MELQSGQAAQLRQHSVRQRPVCILEAELAQRRQRGDAVLDEKLRALHVLGVAATQNQPRQAPELANVARIAVLDLRRGQE